MTGLWAVEMAGQYARRAMQWAEGDFPAARQEAAYGAKVVSEGSLDWGPPAGEGLQFGRETVIAAYDEARAKALARDDLALLQHYYTQYGTRFGGLPNIVEFGLTLTHGSDWLSEGAETVSMTDVVASEVCVACNRLKANGGVKY